MLTSSIKEDIKNIREAALPWEKFANKRILITGAAGFLPAYFVETFLALGDTGNEVKEVVGLVRNRSKAEQRFRHHLSRKNFSLYESHLNGPLSYPGRFDYIIHAASQASPIYYLKDPVGTIMPNVLGTYYLLDRARTDGCEGFLYVSSCEVYGVNGSGQKIDEKQFGFLDPTAVRSCYGESKRMGENLCVCMHHQYGIPTYIGRLAHTYGPGLTEGDGRVFSDFIEDIVARRNIIVKSDGSARRAFCYVSDAISGYLTVLLKGKTACPYNIVNDQAFVSIRELADILVKEFSEYSIKAIFDESKMSTTYFKSQNLGNPLIVDSLRSLGWAPRVGIAEGFRRTVQSKEEEQSKSSKS